MQLLGFFVVFLHLSLALGAAETSRRRPAAAVGFVNRVLSAASGCLLLLQGMRY